MDIEVFSPEELRPVLGALRNVVVANERFTAAERALIEGVALIHDVELDADELESVAFSEVARVVVDPHRRKRAVQLALVAALVEGAPSPETEAQVRSFAAALDLDDAGLAVLHEVAHGHAFWARLDMLRRVRRFIAGSSQFPGFLGFALPALGVWTNESLAASYRELEGCRAGSVGRAVYDHFVDNGFKFPGEAGGIPMAFHDVGHVLAGYGTDPQGEIQQAAFQAGFARRDGFSFLLFGILQFHIGLRITPVAQGYQGLFDVPLVLTALRRGASCAVDLSENYDLFADKDRPLDEVRAGLRIPPLTTALLATVVGGAR
ncbi:MAG TPA: hypothetical protein VNN80_04475 [Polyangiaceae bacterium]|nr:hypothetical protein [Polyangiaceae bacterium]